MIAITGKTQLAGIIQTGDRELSNCGRATNSFFFKASPVGRASCNQIAFDALTGVGQYTAPVLAMATVERESFGLFGDFVIHLPVSRMIVIINAVACTYCDE